MRGPKRTPFQIEHDRREVTSFYLRGIFQKDIAERLGVSQQQVSYDIGIIQKQWRKDTAFDLDAAKRKELARIDELERVYWDAFEQSQGMREKTRTSRREGVGDDKAPQSWAQIEREEMAGVPAFLAGILSCIERRCKILGLDAPKSMVLTGKDGGPIPVVTMLDMLLLAHSDPVRYQEVMATLQAKMIEGGVNENDSVEA